MFSQRKFVCIATLPSLPWYSNTKIGRWVFQSIFLFVGGFTDISKVIVEYQVNSLSSKLTTSYPKLSTDPEWGMHR